MISANTHAHVGAGTDGGIDDGKGAPFMVGEWVTSHLLLRS